MTFARRAALRYALAALVAGALQGGVPVRTQTTPPVDDINLALSHGPGASELTLRWTGGLPSYTLYRSTAPGAVIAPSNLMGLTNSTVWIDAPPAGNIFYYLVLGTGCASDAGCPTGYCVDGYCCDTACDAVCQACNVGGAEGHCMPVPKGQDPGDACGPLAACDGTGFCLKENGAACLGTAECLSGACVDGVCCESACSGLCMQCNQSGALGRCMPIAAQTDPAGECPADAVSSCDRNGFCSGSGTCALYPSGTVCIAPTCTGSVISNQDTCDGSGTCADGGTINCSPYTCSAPGPGGCRTSCVTTAHCATGFACSPTTSTCVTCASTDDPELTFFDANCDGIDGDAARAIFVSPTGSDTNTGTLRTAPVATIQTGISRAVTNGRPHVYISRGTYTGLVNMVSGVSLFGGYDSATAWTRSTSNEVVISNGTVSSGRIIGVNVPAITGGEIQLISVRTLNTAVAGADSYGIYLNGSLGMRLIRVNVLTGQAGPGTSGSAGVQRGAGNNGSPGEGGSCDGFSGGHNSAGGVGCGGNGGLGGVGGGEGTTPPGQGGFTGSGGACGGAGGAGGDPGRDGSSGCDGATGAAGGNGLAGGNTGDTSTGFFVPFNGQNGGAGINGAGGGGGGGGGGQGCTFCNNGTGNGGGGGGAGGCGGTGGGGGQGGSGSFGIFLFNAFNVTISDSTIAAGRGGTGGDAASGGAASSGGFGGLGGTTCPSEVGTGGNGGAGGGGGAGGHGGGGPGGPSYAIYRVNSSIVSTANTLSATGGGPGGASPGNPGPVGASGTLR